LAAKPKRRNKSPNGAARKTKLERAGYAAANLSVSELRRALKKGQEHADNQEWELALPHLLKAWDAMPEDLSLLTILSFALSQLGVRDKAIMVLERTLAVHGATSEICGIMLTLALEMGMHDVARKLCMALIEMEPQVSNHYVNLATAYSGLDMYDEGIEMLQNVLPMFPEDSNLWNVLATQVRSRDGVEASNVFFEEAIRLNPNDFKIFSNFGQSFLMIGDYEKALEHDLRSIELNPDSAEPRLGAAQLLFYMGRFKEAWEHYAFRLSSRRKLSQSQIYTHEIDLWEGQPLEGKTLLIAAEQGIGDEIMWGNYLPFLYEQAEKLIITCDYRLVALFQRRFPKADVERYVDQIISGYRYRSFPVAENAIKNGDLVVDYVMPICSCPQFEWLSIEKVQPHKDGFLISDPDRLADVKARLAAISDKPKIALAWRSGIMSAERAYNYGSIEVLGPLMALADKVDFINIQYGDVSEELAKAKALHGVTIHNFADMNLKDDIDATVAIADACDLTVSSCSAPGQFSMAVGAQTILTGSVKNWWDFCGLNKVSFVRDAEFIIGGEITDWDEIMTRVAKRSCERLGL